jgi:hypothetical protein
MSKCNGISSFTVHTNKSAKSCNLAKSFEIGEQNNQWLKTEIELIYEEYNLRWNLVTLSFCGVKWGSMVIVVEESFYTISKSPNLKEYFPYSVLLYKDYILLKK